MADDVIKGFSPDDAIRVARATLWFERNGMRPPVDAPPAGPIGPLGPLLFNDSNEVIPPNSAVKQTGEDMAGNEVIVKVAKPDTTFGNYLITGAREIAVKGFGRAQDSFRVLAAYSTGSPARGEAFGVKPGSFQLFKGYPPLVIVQKVFSTDRKILQGEVRQILSLVGKCPLGVPAISSDVPGTGTMSIYYLNPADGKLTDTGMTVEVRNLADQAVATNKFVTAIPVDGFWQIIFEACGG